MGALAVARAIVREPEAPNGRRLHPYPGESPLLAARRLWPAATPAEIVAAIEEWECWRMEMEADAWEPSES